MASPVSALGTTSSSTDASSAASLTGASAPTEQMFLQLLVAQLQNQDPLNPTDSTQFVSQLAQFSQLEQVMGIRGDIESYHAQAVAAQTASSSQTDTSSGDTTAQGATGQSSQTQS